MSAYANRPGSTQRTGRGGWVLFAGIYVLVAGLLNLIWGVTALSKKEYFVEGGLVWSNLDLWGWLAILVGLTQCIVAALLLARRMIGTILAIVISMCAIVMAFTTFGAYPGWSAVALVCNALVLWAVTVHGEDFDDGD